MDKKVTLIGAGGHAKVVIDCLLSNNMAVECIYDKDPGKKVILNYDVLIEEDNPDQINVPLIISIGDNDTRKEVAGKIKGKFEKVAHRSAVIDQTVSWGEGTVIFHKSVIQSETQIGNHVIINTAASIDHDCLIGDFCHISPNATLCGGVILGEGVHIGAGATIIPNIKIGKWAVIGAGAVITKDVPDGAVVVGDRGRIVRYRKVL